MWWNHNYIVNVCAQNAKELSLLNGKRKLRAHSHRARVEAKAKNIKEKTTNLEEPFRRVVWCEWAFNHLAQIYTKTLDKRSALKHLQTFQMGTNVSKQDEKYVV